MSLPIIEAAAVIQRIEDHLVALTAEYAKAGALLQAAGVSPAAVAHWSKLGNAEMVLAGETALFRKTLSLPRGVKGGAA